MARLRMGLAVGCIAFAACTTTPPTVKMPPPYPLSLGGVHVTVNQSQHYLAVVNGLRAAGIPISEGPEDLHYMLTVTVGKGKGSSPNCGTLRNVRYTLRYAVVPQARTQRTELRPPIGPAWSAETIGAGARALQLVARGPDGDCSSSVFHQMGAALREQMTGQVQVIDPEDRFYDSDPRFDDFNDQWAHQIHGSDSDIYYANLKQCIEEARLPGRGSGARYDRRLFEVCMKSLGWRPALGEIDQDGRATAAPEN